MVVVLEVVFMHLDTRGDGACICRYLGHQVEKRGVTSSDAQTFIRAFPDSKWKSLQPGGVCLEAQVSRLICFPNLAYSSTLSWVISSRIVPNFSSNSVDSASSFSVASSSISCACSSGMWK